MFEYKMSFRLFNLKTNSHYTFSKEFKTDKPLLMYNDVTDKVTFDFNNEVFNTLCDRLNICIHNSFKKKYTAALKRRLKGTSKGIQIVFRDEDNLIWHCYVSLQNILD